MRSATINLMPGQPIMVNMATRAKPDFQLNYIDQVFPSKFSFIRYGRRYIVSNRYIDDKDCIQLIEYHSDYHCSNPDCNNHYSEVNISPDDAHECPVCSYINYPYNTRNVPSH